MNSKGSGDNKSGLGGAKSAASGAGQVIDSAKKLPVIGGMIEGSISYAKKAIGIIVAYLLVTFCGVLPALGLADFILWLKNGITKSESPTGIQCYGGFDLTPKEMKFKLNSKIPAIGSAPTNFNNGQTAQWIYTGFVTTGAPLEIYVNGAWYPWGKGVVDKVLVEKETTEIISNGNPDVDGAVQHSYSVEEKDKPCLLSTDIFFFDDALPKDSNGAPDYTKLTQLRQINHLMRYSNPNNDLDDQVEYIMDVHCTGNNENQPMGHICSPVRSFSDRDFVPCYLDRGHGVYMKIGNVNYAYHLANHEIAMFNKVVDENTGKITYAQAKDDYGNNVTMIVPFSLPTKTYQNFRRWNSIDKISWLTTGLENVSGNIELPGANDLIIANNSNACGNLNDYPNSVNETCPPPPDMPIYVTIKDTYYSDNDGDVEIVFKSGAKNTAGNNVFYDGSVFTSIATFIFEPMFGKEAINYKNAGQSYHGTNQNKNVISLKPDGAAIAFRNMILSSFTFQLFRILLVILYVMFYGYEIFVKQISFDIPDITKRLLNIGLGLWATDSTNYEFLDSFLIPLFFGAFNDLAIALVQACLNFAGIDTVVTDPFGAFDIMLSQFFSDVMGYKMIGLFNAGFLFAFSLLFIWIFILIVVVVMIRTALVYVLSIFMLGFLFVIGPMVCLMMLSEYTAYAFDGWKNSLIREASYSVFSLFFVSLLFAIIVKPFKILFSFDVCWKALTSFKFFFFSITIYGWKIPNPPTNSNFFVALLFFAISAVVMMQFKDKLLGIVEILFGKSGLAGPAMGENILENIIGTVSGSDTKGLGVSPNGIFGNILGRIPSNRLKTVIGGVGNGFKQVRGLFGSKNPFGDAAKIAGGIGDSMTNFFGSKLKNGKLATSKSIIPQGQDNDRLLSGSRGAGSGQRSSGGKFFDGLTPDAQQLGNRLSSGVGSKSTRSLGSNNSTRSRLENADTGENSSTFVPTLQDSKSALDKNRDANVTESRGGTGIDAMFKDTSVTLGSEGVGDAPFGGTQLGTDTDHSVIPGSSENNQTKEKTSNTDRQREEYLKNMEKKKGKK